MGKASRDKGKRGERELAQRLRGYGYTAAHRGVQYQGGEDSPDVVGLPGIHIECKRVEQLRLWASLQQSADDAGENEYPVVMHRRNREDWIVIQPLDTWIKLYEAWDKEQS